MSYSIKGLPEHVSPFPPLRLTEHIKEKLRRTMHQLVDESVRDFAAFVDRYPDPSAVLPKDQWKMLRQEDGVRVYLERSDKSASPTIGARGNELATIVGYGTIAGTIADCVFPVATTTVEEARVRGAYINDTRRNVVILDVLEEPSLAAPFQTMTIRWGVKSLGRIMRTMLKDEDWTLVEATGITTSKQDGGAEIAYHLFHSIELPGLPEIKEYTRAELSAVTLWKALDAHRMLMYVKTFADFKTSLTCPIFHALAEVLCFPTKYPDISARKKLTWILQCKARRSRSVHDDKAQDLFSVIQSCIACNKPLDRPFGSRKHRCVLCCMPICSACSLPRVLYVMTAQKDVREYGVRLCTNCWELVRNSDTEQTAIAQLRNDVERNATIYVSLGLDAQSEAPSDLTESELGSNE